MLNKYKLLIPAGIFVLFMLIGICDVHALTTVQTPSIISIKQYSGDRVIKNCTNTTSCDYSSDSTNLQYVQTTYNYNFTKGKRYKIKANGYYRWGSPISMNPEFQHLLEERVAFTAPYFKLETTQCYIKVTDYVVEDSSNYNEVSQMSYNVEYTCEFSPEANFTSIAFMTLTDATLLTSNLTIMNSGMTVEEVVNNLDIINNANNNQGQTNQRLDEVNDNLKDLDNTLNSTDGPSNLEDIADIAGYFPAGPIDSILNLPLSFAQNLLNSIQGQCSPVVLPLPFIGGELTIPCINDLYSQIRGLDILINSIGIIGGVLILYNYLCHLKDWLDSVLTLSIRTDWGGMFDSSSRGGSN